MLKNSKSHHSTDPGGRPPADAPSHFGRYEVERVIGCGIAGVVYLARDPLIDRAVAIKSLRGPKGGEADGEDLARFEREIRIAGAFAHTGIVTIFDVGFDPDSTFIAMEYVDGGSLEHEMAEQGVLALQRALDLTAPLTVRTVPAFDQVGALMVRVPPSASTRLSLVKTAGLTVIVLLAVSAEIVPWLVRVPEGPTMAAVPT